MPKTYFDPLVDGFAFVNSWQFDQAETDQIRNMFAAAVTTAVSLLNPIFGAIIGLTGVSNTLAGWITNAANPGGYGLCGGMAFTALDYYKSGKMLPQGMGKSDQPTRNTATGTALRDYLWQRQLDSLVPSAASQTLAYMAVLHLVPKEWPFSGGHHWLRNRSRQEWEVLKGHIDAGDPWPIGLVGTSGDPFDQHQVLAYGYDDPGDGTGRIYVYDPNCVLDTVQVPNHRRSTWTLPVRCWSRPRLALDAEARCVASSARITPSPIRRMSACSIAVCGRRRPPRRFS